MAISASACLDVYHRRITTDEAKGDALDHLAMDATESEIISYLDGRGYSHTEASAAGTETYLASAGVSPETLVIRGFIPDSSRSLLIEGHIILYFVLGGDRRLERLIVHERLEEP
jgi:hypothetical protein